MPPDDCTCLLGFILCAFGSSEGQPRYDKRADLNGDTVVNAQDLMEWRRRCRPGAAASATGPITLDLGEGVAVGVTVRTKKK